MGTHGDDLRALNVALNESDTLTLLGDCAQGEGENPIFGSFTCEAHVELSNLLTVLSDMWGE